MSVSLALLICVKGFAHPPLNPRIVGGADAPEGSWPWMVSLTYDSGTHFCGGSLITDEWVLTAAHCVKGKDKTKLHAHFGKRTQQGVNPHEITKTIKNIIHDSFDKDTFDKDIALLQLSSKVNTDDHIRPVSLAAENSVFVTNTMSWITGWGDIGRNAPLPNPGSLQETAVLVLSNSECDNLCQEVVTNNMICAGLMDGGRGHWKGDSGGPMVNRWCSSWVQSGIISWTEGCAEPNKPDGYTSVSKYQQWITSKIHANLPRFVLFPPGPCSATSQTSTSCNGRCNEKFNAGNACNCHVSCEPNCCKDYNHQCLS